MGAEIQETTESEEASWTATHGILMPPSVQAGDHLFICFSFDGYFGSEISTPSGWTLLKLLNLWTNSTQQLAVFIKEADGTEGGTTVDISSTPAGKNYRGVSATNVLRFKGGRAGVTEGTTWEVVHTSSGYGTIVNPPEITASWGAEDNTFIAIAWAGGHSPTVTTFPAGYSNTADHAQRAMVATCVKETSSDAADDPSAFTISGSNNNRGMTIVLRPAATVLAGADTATGTGTANDATIDPPTVRAFAETAEGTGEAFWGRIANRQIAADLTVEWDLDGDGDYDETEEDITARVLAGSLRRGRDYASQVTGKSTPGELRLTVRNEDDAFGFFNSASPLNTTPFSLKTGRKIRVRTTESSPTEPTVLARQRFNGSGALTTTTDDNARTWTARSTATFSQFGGELIAGGPPAPASVGLAEVDPSAYSISLENGGVYTDCLRPASGESISLRSQSELTITGTSTSHNLTLPATVEADDLLMVFVETQDSGDAGAPTTPAGWTSRTSQKASGSFRPRITCFYKIADGTEDSSTFTITHGSGTEVTAVALCYDGVDTTTPFDVAVTTIVGGSSNLDPPALTPVTGEALVLTIYAGNHTSGTTLVSGPSGFTLVKDQITSDDIGFIIHSQGQPSTTSGTEHLATIDIGVTTYHAQCQIPLKDTVNEVGLVFNYTDSANYNLLYLADGTITVSEKKAGVWSTLATGGAENRNHVNLGLACNGTTIIAYLDGVQELSTTATITATSHLGLYGKWFSQREPKFTELWVWNRSRIVQAWETDPADGVLATMQVTKVQPFVDASHRKRAEITAIGLLGQLDRTVSAPESTGPDDVQSAGVKAGHMIGNTLARVNALHPQGVIDPGFITLGSVGFDRQRAISLVRRFEETDGGLVFEAKDGSIHFKQRDARDASTVIATFSDDLNQPGFPPENLSLLDWQGDIINRVRSEVSPSLPRQVFGTDSNVENTGVANDHVITIPAEGTGDTDAAVGDLFLVVFSSTVFAADVTWITPPGWTDLRGLNDEEGMRVYAKRLTAGEFGDSVTFYDDSTPAGGAWVAMTALVKNWYGVIDSGVAMTEVAGYGGGSAEARAGDNDPPVMFTPWGISPTLFIALRAGMGADSTSAVVSSDTDDNAPDGFDSLGSITEEGTANAQDVGLQWARRIRTEQVQNPARFGGQFTGYDLVETAVIAVRGFAGISPPSSGGDPVISDNDASQVDRNAVLDHPSPGILFATVGDAEEYNDLILTRYAEDRPIVEFDFTATKDHRLRTMAIDREVGDRVRLDLDGQAGVGTDAEFYIEAITHSFAEGLSLWQTRFECSPVAELGGGADLT